MPIPVDLPSPVAEALDLVDAGALAALTSELVRIPSVTGSDAESDAQHHLAGLMQAAGLDVDLWEIDLAAAMADPGFPGLEAPRSQAWGLVGAAGPDRTGDEGPTPTVVLNGHIDVVPPGARGDWTVDPFGGEIRGDTVTGRGTCDMKAGLACQLVSLRLLQQAGVPLPRVLLQSVVGEEDGGLGTFATLRRGYRGDVAVICEPTSLALVPAAAGALTFRLTVPGRAAHASMRTAGVDAIDKYLLVHAALRALESRRNARPHPLLARYDIAYPLSVGTLRAGDWPSTVPDRVLAEGRLGVALGEPVEQARQDLEQAVAEVCARDPWLSDHPVTVDWFGGQFASGEVAADSLPARLVAEAHALVTGRLPDIHGVPYGSDMRLLTGIGGVPAVHYGPGDVARAHAPDESVPISDLVTVTRTLITLLALTGEAGVSVPALGVVFRPELPPERLAAVARTADAAGLDELWLWEDCFKESGIAAAAAALAWTERLGVGVGLLPVPLRNVALTAMEIATMTRLFGDRFTVGIGHGVQDWMGQVGARVASPLTLLREYTVALKALLAGERVSTDGRYVHLDSVALDWPPARAPRILAGAIGAKTLALSGEVADGTIMVGGTTPDEVRQARQAIDGGRALAGRADPHHLTVFLIAATGPTADERLARELTMWPVDAARDVAVAGDAGAVAAAVRRWADAGVDSVVLQPTSDEPDLEAFIGFVTGQVAPLL